VRLCGIASSNADSLLLLLMLLRGGSSLTFTMGEVGVSKRCRRSGALLRKSRGATHCVTPVSTSW
jgi:hypothetical protein